MILLMRKLKVIRLSEKIVYQSTNNIFCNTLGWIIVSTFISNISRIQQIISIARQYRRKVPIIGHSMELALQFALKNGYIKIKNDDLIDINEIKNFHNHEICIICTGSQGEPGSVLSKIPHSEHKIHNDKDGMKKNVLKILKEKYKLDEEDLTSAEIEAVPAFPAKDYGIDCSMVSGYGQDDRSYAYWSVKALLDADIKSRNYTSCFFFVEKEEIGSESATGSNSYFIENVIMELLKLSLKTNKDDLFFFVT